MPSTTTALDLTTDVTSLTAAVCDIESVSLDERTLADAVEAAVRDLAHLEVTRIGNTVVARTDQTGPGRRWVLPAVVVEHRHRDGVRAVVGVDGG